MEHQDMTFDKFIDMVFKHPVQDPFSFDFSFIDQIPDKTQQNQLLGQFVVTGAKMLYDKQLAQLTESEIGVLKKYMLSIGFDVKYETKVQTKKVVDYHPDNTPYDREVSFNHLNIMFNHADRKLYNIHPNCGQPLI